MKRVILGLSVLGLLGCFGPDAANGAVILQTETYGGHTYHLVGSDASGAGINWTDSEAFGVSLGGHLVTINDAAEDAFLFGAFGSAQFGTYGPVNSLLIGMTDQASEGTWVWISGEPAAYDHWHTGEPSNTHNREDWGSIPGALTGWPVLGTWNDVPDWSANGDPFYGIVELNTAVPEPTSVALWSGLGILGMFAVRRRRQRVA